MRFSTSSWLFVSLFACLSASASAQTEPTSSTFIDPRDTLRRQLDDEKRRTMDPLLGTVPYERLAAAREKILKDRRQGITSQSGIPNVTWQERGPNNFAGRSRTALFDLSDGARKRVWVGTLTSGLWQTNDITDANAVWTPQSDNWENTVVTAIAADPSNPQIVYVATGDYYTSKAGGGIWKTTTGGASWTRLSSTIPVSTGSYPSLGRAFTFIQRMVVNSSGQVFAATQYGVVRSVDGGSTWQFVLEPNMGIGFGTSTGQYYNDLVNDIELASDGILYASFSPSRVFKSTSAAGTTWTEITPATGGERTELAVSPATSGGGQVLYAVSRAYNNVNYNQDIKWFKKSVNAGASWTDVTIPVPYSDAHFTAGNGYTYMDITAHPTDPNTVYAGGYNLFRSVDGGAGWTKLTETGSNSTLYNQTGLQCTPGGTGFITTVDQGIYWSPDGAGTIAAVPTILSRTTGIKAGEAYTVAMKGSPGSNYFMANVQPQGIITMTAPNGGVGVSSGTLWGTGSTNTPYIDTNEPNIQIFSGYNSVNVYNGSSYQQIFTINNSPFTADYDSQANTLYTYDYVNSQHIIRRTTGIGTSPVNTTMVLTGVTDQLTYLKLGTDRTALFAGNAAGVLYKLTNLAQTTPTIVRIDNGVLGQATVSCIDVGATDNELLVTLSNYGVQSVWYTADGGDSWAGKDQTNYGLPDVPVRTALFNPQNRQQVLLGTDLGIWSTTNILAGNPGWGVMSGSLPLNRVNQLRYRASDGRIAAATVGRGIWTTDAFAIPYTLPTVTLTGVSTTSLCAGSTLTVSFNTSGAFGAGNQFEVWLSDATGSFVNQKRIGSGSSSPVSAALPGGYNALPYGTNYLLKVIASDPEVASGASAALSIGNLDNATVLDRNGNSGSSQICVGSQATLQLQGKDYYGNSLSSDSYQWTRNGVVISGAVAQSYVATQSGTYSASIIQAGCVKKAYDYTLTLGSSFYASIVYPTVEVPQCTGQTIVLKAQCSSDNAFYQWNKDGTPINGATGVVYPVTQTGRYTLSVQDGTCSSLSNPLTYEFGSSINATIRYGNPADSLICGNYLTNYASANMYVEGGGNYTALQWYKDGIPINGATGSNYYASGPGVYHTKVQKGACQTISNALIRSVTTQMPVKITYNGTKTLCPGESRYLSAQTLSNAGYQWQKDGDDIVGAISSTYSVTAAGTYSVRVAIGNSCTTSSDTRSFLYTNAIVPKIVSRSPEACSSLYMSTYETSSDYYDPPSGFTYQWQKDGVDLAGATQYYNHATSTGVYTVRLTKGACSGVSKGIYYNYPSPPKPVLSYVATDKCVNGVAKLSVISTIYGTYQWKRNGEIIANPAYYYGDYYPNKSGRYTFSFSNPGCTSVESDPVDVKIGEPTAATIVGNALVNAGQTAYLPISFSGPAPWSLTLSNGQSATAITQNPYMMPVSPTATTTYSVSSVVNACGTGTTSGNAVVTVGTGSADVSLGMAVNTRTPRVGDVVSYSLNVANAGPTDAAGLQLQSLLPTGVSFLDGVSPGITHSNGVVNVAAGSVLAGMTSSFVFRATITEPGTFATAAQITASQTPDPDSQPNSGTGDGQDDAAQVDVRTTDRNGPYVISPNPNQVPLPRLRGSQPPVNPSAVELSLQLDLDKLVANVAQQEVITATLTVRNRGGVPATGVVVRVLLPNGAATPTSGWQVIDTQTLAGYFNSIPAGGSATLQLFWRPSAAGDLKAQVFEVTEPTTGFIPGNGYALGEKDDVQTRIRVR
ncbi:DUF11 domain-containing protein [Fibrella sp. HMF5335]|uniref:DUF11 domain-containing protein n=1 Tax=Fibrella rubiginis TaxID=2817060 RepID=A0A939GL93_9BACT|nr:DUF11 domain-containing protein [Fibrella rubiginis]MBO0938796.1 DUF11 domain-containing protein [Fibrella rubiginis]